MGTGLPASLGGESNVFLEIPGNSFGVNRANVHIHEPSYRFLRMNRVKHERHPGFSADIFNLEGG